MFYNLSYATFRPRVKGVRKLAKSVHLTAWNVRAPGGASPGGARVARYFHRRI